VSNQTRLLPRSGRCRKTAVIGSWDLWPAELARNLGSGGRSEELFDAAVVGEVHCGYIQPSSFFAVERTA